MAVVDPAAAVQQVLARVRGRDGHEQQFLQAVEEVLGTLGPYLSAHPEHVVLLERLVEPERMIVFRVPWVDDAGRTQVNRGFRVQFSSAIGPYKGGLRFHPSVNLSVVKFLGFEQIFKNSLTGLPLGGGKGGSDFDPKGKSDREVMSFCQSFMSELYRHIGANTDVPAGDIGVGAREIGYLYGQFKRLRNAFEGVLTGKGVEYGGSLMRPEATGFGVVYFLREMLREHGRSLEGSSVLVSGAGNVAQFAVKKLIELGARVVTVSDSTGYVLEPEGFSADALAVLQRIKNVERKSLEAYAAARKGAAQYVRGKRPWGAVAADVALPCAHENEIEEEDAQHLVDSGVRVVVEGANMPTHPAAQAVLQRAGVLFGPAKAANAGGVAVSGLEMAQDSQRDTWTAEQVDERLQGIMRSIFVACKSAADDAGAPHNYALGANVAGFAKVARAMDAQGVV